MVAIGAATNTTLTNVLESGTLSMQLKPQSKLSVLKGDIRNNPRGHTTIAFQSRIGDVVGVTKAKSL